MTGIVPRVSGLGLLSRRRRAASSFISQWLLRDDFTTDESAPIASPRTAEPGPGTWNRGGSSSFYLIENGRLKTTGTADWNSTFAYNHGESPAAGVAAMVRFARPNPDSSNGQFGWSGTNYYPNMWFGSGDIAPHFSMSNKYLSIGVGVTKDVFAVSCGASVAIVADDTLQYVDTHIGQYFGFAPNTGSEWLNSLRIVELTAPWNTDYGIATSRVASPSNGETTTMEADAIVEFTWTPAAGETLDLMVRRDSDADCWSVVCAESTATNPDTIKLIERNGGDTERSSTSQTFSAGTAYRIVVVCDGSSIETYVANVAKNSYASASHNQTSTGVKVSGFTTGSDLVAWPRTLSGAAKAALDEVANA